MAERILQHANQVLPYVDDVQRLADGHRNEFGFLPMNAYDDSAIRNNLWVVVEKNSRVLQGYLLIGGQYPHMKVFQICVHPDHRSSGIGRMLISELIRYSTDRGFLNITARVSSRLKAANGFWQQAGFYIIREEPGKGQRTTIRIYSRHLDIPSLFGNEQPSVDQSTIQIDPRRPLLHTPSYVIDLNVFFDAVRNRDNGQCSQIIASSLRHEIRLFVTSEFATELDRTSQDRKNDPIMTFAKVLPTLPQVGSDRLQAIVTDLRNLFSSTSPGPRQWTINDVSDQIHLASSIHHRVFGFITSDSAILRHSDRLYERFRLRVLSPDDVVDIFETEDHSVIHVPMSISEKREIRVSNLNDSNSASVDQFLQRHSTRDQSLSWWRSAITGHVLPAPLVVSSAQQIVGIGLWTGTSRSRSDAVLHLIVDEYQPESDRAIDYMLSFSANIGEVGRVWKFNLKIPRKQIRTRETALKRGFHPQRSIDNDDKIEFTRVVVKRPVVSGYWPRLASRFRDETGLGLAHSMPSYQELENTGIVLSREGVPTSWPMSLFDFETFISPGLLITPRRGAVIVSIQERYADELLPEASNQRLLVSHHDAAFRLERAYFLKAGMHAFFPRGQLVVFYISRPRSQAVALSRVTYSETLTKTQAMLRLIRQGVLSEDEIRRRANDRNEITVFTFDNLLRFPQSIDFSRLKEMGCISDANLVTAEKISDVAVRRIVKEAFGVNFR